MGEQAPDQQLQRPLQLLAGSRLGQLQLDRERLPRPARPQAARPRRAPASAPPAPDSRGDRRPRREEAPPAARACRCRAARARSGGRRRRASRPCRSETGSGARNRRADPAGTTGRRHPEPAGRGVGAEAPRGGRQPQPALRRASAAGPGRGPRRFLPRGPAARRFEEGLPGALRLDLGADSLEPPQHRLPGALGPLGIGGNERQLRAAGERLADAHPGAHPELLGWLRRPRRPAAPPPARAPAPPAAMLDARALRRRSRGATRLGSARLMARRSPQAAGSGGRGRMRQASNICSYTYPKGQAAARPCESRFSRVPKLEHDDRSRDCLLHRPAGARLPGAAPLALLPEGRRQAVGGRPARRRQRPGQARRMALQALQQVAQGRQQERLPRAARAEPRRRSSSQRMAKREPTTRELRLQQKERTTDEHRAVDQSMTADEAQQHQRRAAKSAYLERMLAERERSERETRLTRTPSTEPSARCGGCDHLPMKLAGRRDRHRSLSPAAVGAMTAPPRRAPRSRAAPIPRRPR